MCVFVSAWTVARFLNNKSCINRDIKVLLNGKKQSLWGKGPGTGRSPNLFLVSLGARSRKARTSTGERWRPDCSRTIPGKCGDALASLAIINQPETKTVTKNGNPKDLNDYMPVAETNTLLPQAPGQSRTEVPAVCLPGENQSG